MIGKAMLFALVALLAGSSGVAWSDEPPAAKVPRKQQIVGIEGWEQRHPEASKELGNWVKQHPEGAAEFFDWDGKHATRFQTFVNWATTHLEESLEAFTTEHDGRAWVEFNAIVQKHPPAAESFVQWCRKHSEAAIELSLHPNGLKWCGNHLFRAFWKLEHLH